MDQACAYNAPVSMTFDGPHLDVEPLKLHPGTELSLLLVDLRAAKDTVEILKGLQSAYPIARNEKEAALHELLGESNAGE